MTSKYQNGCHKTKDVNFWLPQACIENIKMAATKQKIKLFLLFKFMPKFDARSQN